MRPLPTLVLSWLVTGLGAFLGSIVGNAAGRQGLLAGAIVGGVAGVLASVVMARRLAWLPPAEVRGAFLGGLAGFALAVPVTLLNMDTPIVPLLSFGLVGAGVLLGAGAARGAAR